MEPVAENEDGTVAQLADHLVREGDRIYGQATARNMRTAVSRVRSAMLAEDPDSVRWVMNNATEIVQRLISAGKIGQVSAASYRSRVRGAAATFLDSLQTPARPSQPSESPRPAPVVARTQLDALMRSVRNTSAHLPKQLELPRGLQQELSEAMFYAARWPTLQKYILPALTQALEDARKEGRK